MTPLILGLAVGGAAYFVLKGNKDAPAHNDISGPGPSFADTSRQSGLEGRPQAAGVASSATSLSTDNAGDFEPTKQPAAGAPPTPAPQSTGVFVRPAPAPDVSGGVPARVTSFHETSSAGPIAPRELDRRLAQQTKPGGGGLLLKI